MKQDFIEDDEADLTNDEFEKFMKFLKAANEAIKERGATYEWICPLCDGKCMGGKAKCNGHIHAGCQDCKVSIMQ